jgi:hypothetical protein
MSSHPLIRFLQDELAVSPQALELAWRGCNQAPHLLPMTLWQYGLISLQELELTFDWTSQPEWPAIPKEGLQIRRE